MLNDCRQQQQKLFKEALLEVSKKGLQHSCLESDLKETCSAAEPLQLHWSGSDGVSPCPAPWSQQQELQVHPDTLSFPTQPAPILSRPSQQSLLCLAVSSGCWHTWAHWTMALALCSQAQDHFTVLPTAKIAPLLLNQCPLSSRRWPTAFP